MTAPTAAPEPPPGRASRIIHGHGIRYSGRTYTAGWMAAHAERTVRIHTRGPDTVEVSDAATGHLLGTAHAQQPASPDPARPDPLPTAKDTDMTETTQPTPPRPDEDEVVGEPDFYLNLADARIVATEALLEASENIADTIEARAMSCIYGDAGLGKTFSVLAALKEVSAERVLLLQFRSRPTPPRHPSGTVQRTPPRRRTPLAPQRVRPPPQADSGPQALRPGLRRSPAVQPRMLRVRPPPLGHR